MTQMGIPIDRWPTDIHAHVGSVQGFERFFSSCQRVVNNQWIHYAYFYFVRF